MAEPPPNPFDLLVEQIRAAVREEIAAARFSSARELLEPEELAARIKVPLSWVYEQSRQGAIPTHRIGRYYSIRFERSFGELEVPGEERTSSRLTRVK